MQHFQPEFAEEILNFVVVPGCLVSSLRGVKFGNVNERSMSFLVKFFVEKGKMHFSLPNHGLNYKVMEGFEKLYSF